MSKKKKAKKKILTSMPWSTWWLRRSYLLGSRGPTPQPTGRYQRLHPLLRSWHHFSVVNKRGKQSGQIHTMTSRVDGGGNRDDFIRLRTIHNSNSFHNSSRGIVWLFPNGHSLQLAHLGPSIPLPFAQHLRRRRRRRKGKINNYEPPVDQCFNF